MNFNLKGNINIIMLDEKRPSCPRQLGRLIYNMDGLCIKLLRGLKGCLYEKTGISLSFVLSYSVTNV